VCLKTSKRGVKGLETTLACKSDGVDLAKRRSGAVSVGEPRCTALSSGTLLYFAAGLAPRRTFRHRLSVCSADLVRLAATGWRRPKWGVEYDLPKLITVAFDHPLARWPSLGETRIRPSQVTFGTIVSCASR
jgi:hypothetical protein